METDRTLFERNSRDSSRKHSARFTFGLPRGDAGPTGSPGQQGTNGLDGSPGPQVPPFAAAIIDGVTALDSGNAATVGVVYDGSNVRFTFGIPRGVNGINGVDGGPGPQGTPGEVSNAQLASAISGTSNNSSGVAALGLTISDPPSQAEMQQIANKLDELIAALRR